MNTMAFAEAIQIKVMESDESFALDEVRDDYIARLFICNVACPEVHELTIIGFAYN